MEDNNKTQKPLELNEKEQAVIKTLREREEARTACAMEVDAVLKSHNATIGINPNSPFGKPEMVISIK